MKTEKLISPLIWVLDSVLPTAFLMSGNNRSLPFENNPKLKIYLSIGKFPSRYTCLHGICANLCYQCHLLSAVIWCYLVSVFLGFSSICCLLPVIQYLLSSRVCFHPPFVVISCLVGLQLVVGTRRV